MSIEYSLASNGGSVVATNEYPGGGYEAVNLIDGNDANLWHSSGGFPCTVEVTLPFPVLVDRIYLGFVSNQTRSYVIQALVNGSWITKDTVSATETEHDLHPTPFVATKVRYVVSSDDYTIARLRNFKVFGVVPPTVSIDSPSTGGSAVSGNMNVVISCEGVEHPIVDIQLLVNGYAEPSLHVTGSDLTGHTFTINTNIFNNGDNTIQARVTDSASTQALSSIITKTFHNAPIISDLGLNTQYPRIGQNINFDPIGTNLGGTWSINYGDGNTGTDINANHAYSVAGDYTVSVVNHGTYGDSVAFEVDITVVKVTSAGNAVKVANSATLDFNTTVPSPVFSVDSGLGSINSSTGLYTAPSSGQGVATIKAENDENASIYATKNILYGFPFVHNNGNDRTFDASTLPAGYDYKARVKSVDEQGNTLGFTDWVEALTE